MKNMGVKSRLGLRKVGDEHAGIQYSQAASGSFATKKIAPRDEIGINPPEACQDAQGWEALQTSITLLFAIVSEALCDQTLDAGCGDDLHLQLQFQLAQLCPHDRTVPLGLFCHLGDDRPVIFDPFL